MYICTVHTKPISWRGKNTQNEFKPKIHHLFKSLFNEFYFLINYFIGHYISLLFCLSSFKNNSIFIFILYFNILDIIITYKKKESIDFLRTRKQFFLFLLFSNFKDNEKLKNNLLFFHQS